MNNVNVGVRLTIAAAVMAVGEQPTRELGEKRWSEELYLWVVERAPNQGATWFNGLERAVLSLEFAWAAA